MIFKSMDGRFYEQPVWEVPKAIVKVHDDFLVLFYIGKVGWTHARRVLSKFGISARLVVTLSPLEMVINGKLVESTPFVLWPLKEVGVPHAYDFSYGPDYIGESWKYDPRLKFEQST